MAHFVTAICYYINYDTLFVVHVCKVCVWGGSTFQLGIMARLTYQPTRQQKYIKTVQ